jgi:hypothetical protein
VDANEFLKKVTPAVQRSRLAPFWGDITKLRDSGCTLEQVCEFLAANQVQISIAGLSKYIKRREEKDDGRQVQEIALRTEKVPATKHENAMTPNNEHETPVVPISATGGKIKTEQLLDAPNKNFSFKQLQKNAKESK